MSQKHDSQRLFKKSFPENQARPRKPKSPFSVFYTPKNKKNAGHRPESSPAAPRNPFCLQIGNAKVHFSNQKQGRNDTFPRCLHIHHRKKKATMPKTSHLRPLQDKNDKSLKPTPKIHHSQRNNPKGKTILKNGGRQCVWNPYLKAHPPFHFSKIDASSLENQRFTKSQKYSLL